MAKKREQRQAMYYNTSANAYKYDVSVEEYYDDAPQTAAAPAAAPRPKKKLRAIVTGAAVAAFCLALGMVRVAQYERLSAANLRVNKLRSTISSIEEEIETLNVKLEYAMDINSVQLIARDELGMDYPEHEQVVAAALPEAPAMLAAAPAEETEQGEQAQPAEGTIGKPEGAAAVPRYAAVPVSVPEEQGGE